MQGFDTDPTSVRQAAPVLDECLPAAAEHWPQRRLAVAPMMAWTDRHFRHLARRLSRHCLLYTEMVTAAAILHGDRERLLGRGAENGPVVLQLGGADADALARAAAIGEGFGYHEINLNCGCPSDRVRSGAFGACLMADPVRVGELVAAMRGAVGVPVSVKCRLGIDRRDDYDDLRRFVETVATRSGCTLFTVHARKAWLDGLSPAENRSIPPLRHEHVARLKREYPELHVTANGGLADWQAIDARLGEVDGVMIGRHAYQRPAFLAEVDAHCFADLPGARRQGGIEGLVDVARDYARYMVREQAGGERPASLLHPLIPLFRDCAGSRRWRQLLSGRIAPDADLEALVERALEPVLSGRTRDDRTASATRTSATQLS